MVVVAGRCCGLLGGCILGSVVGSGLAVQIIDNDASDSFLSFDLLLLLLLFLGLLLLGSCCTKARAVRFETHPRRRLLAAVAEMGWFCFFFLIVILFLLFVSMVCKMRWGLAVTRRRPLFGRGTFVAGVVWMVDVVDVVLVEKEEEEDNDEERIGDEVGGNLNRLTEFGS